MRNWLGALVAALLFLGISGQPKNDKNQDEEAARKFIRSLDEQFSKAGNEEMVARWNYITDITSEHESAMNKARLQFQELKRSVTHKSDEFDWDSFKDEDLKRQNKFYVSLGSKLPNEKLEQMNYLSTVMESAYSTAKICDYGEDLETCTPSLELEPDIVDLFATSRNASKLKHAWVEWRKASGNKYKNAYLEFIDINTELAKSLGYETLYDLWVAKYEKNGFDSVIDEVWREEVTFEDGETISLEQFYKLLHSYVREKLRLHYADKGENIKKHGYIPAHLLGNVWAQTWEQIEDITKPIADAPILDVTEAMVKQNYTALKMFKLAESFFEKLGFDGMTSTFWEKSMLEKPSDREVVCHASAEDFFTQEDFRIKMCTSVNHADLVTVHHEMGHIVYFMEYKKQPFVYRDSANPGFHEAIGDTMALAVNTPAHLESIGLLEPTKSRKKEDIDTAFLFRMALDKVSFLPYAFALDQWRWKLFRGQIDGTNMNKAWWDLRRSLQGIDAPVPRSESDFDPGAKYHVPANVPYIRYFVSFVVQFQFYEALCKRSKQYVESDPSKPLHQCDFSLGGADTGSLIREMMQSGFSKPWPEVLETMTGSPRLSGRSLLQYFRPLIKFLQSETEKSDLCVGWAENCEKKAQKYLDEVFEKKQRELFEVGTQKSWEYMTDISDATSAAALEETEKQAKFAKEVWEEITQYDYKLFKNESTKRQCQIHAVLGTAALSEAKFSQLNNIIANMTSTYGSAKLCPFKKQDCDLATEGLTLEPSLESIISSPDKYSSDELVYVWKGWRDVTGKKMRSQFSTYVDLYNEAAVANGLPDASELWLENYYQDDPQFRKDLETLWAEIRPMFERLHAYVRYRLAEFLGDDELPEDEPLPAHVLGNMWAQSWDNIYRLVIPYANQTNPLDEVNQALKDKNYSVRDLFELSNDFYLEMGLKNMSVCYDAPCGLENTPENHECQKSHPMIEKPNWDVVCHASAWDMYKADLNDYRIKMCTDVNLEDLITIHHEMGHIQYYMQYASKPITFREGANNGFHEAIGDTMALAVSTPKHLESVGLLSKVSESYEADINYLMKTALDKVVFLPFAYTIDRFRWALFDGSIDKHQMNSEWWKLREEFQGLRPPVNRSEEDFDAACKYHVAADVPYIRYFASHILQYMFYKQMCLDSQQYNPLDETKPLYKCDFSQGAYASVAGNKLRDMMKEGSSRPWPEILEEMTGHRKMSASALLEYFKPLDEWLKKTIKENNIHVGWTSTVNEYLV